MITSRHFPLKGKTALLGLPACGALAAGVIAFTPTAAHADTSCTYGDSDGNTQTCLQISNGAVTSSASIVNNGSGRVLQTCVHYADGQRLDCTGFQYVGPGGGIADTWIGSTSNAGFCAVTWRQNTDGSTTQIGQSCGGTTTIG